MLKVIFWTLVCGSVAMLMNCLEQNSEATNLLLDKPDESLSTCVNLKLSKVSVDGSHLKDYIYSKENLRLIRHYFHSRGQGDFGISSDTFISQVVIGRHQINLYNDLFIRRYDSDRDIELSNGAEVEQDRCVNELIEIVERATQVYGGRSQDRDLKINTLLDTYGRLSPDMYGGRAVFAGSYAGCIISHLNMTQGRQEMKYCSAKFKHNKWTQDTPLSEHVFVWSGVCLPKSCDAKQYKNKYDLVERLVNLNDPEYAARGLKLTGLYCLPDEDSPMRQWWRSPPTLRFVCMASLWFIILVWATLRYETDRARNSDQSSGLYAALAITRNFGRLFKTSRGSDDSTNVDLSILDGIKVLCSQYIIFGHMLMWSMSICWNALETSNDRSFAYYAPYLVPAFAVNAFFVVTGMMTTYLIFSQNQKHRIITDPWKWLAVIIYRYLRVMPTYLFVVLYSKHVARYTGSGPLWDYGTSSLGSRRHCENESILWVLLFGASHKSPFDHCIASAWSLADDFQFFLVTPILMVILYLYPTIGKRVFELVIVVCSLANFYYVFNTDADLRPTANFDLNGFKIQAIYAVHTYTRPFYRIPSYIVGLLFGYALHNFNQSKDQSKHNKLSIKAPEALNRKEAIWPSWFVKRGPLLSLILMSFCCILPIICSYIPFSVFGAKIFVAASMPIGHLVFAYATGSYILLAMTGYGNKHLNRFLSLPIWKPLGQLSLCIVLINLEVIQYYSQTYTEMQQFSDRFLISATIICSSVTYLVSIVLFIAIESPIRNLLSLVIARSFSLQQITKEKKAQ